MNRTEQGKAGGAKQRPLPPLPHPSWYRQRVSGNPLSVQDFWKRLGL
jgi:hypothetical protein